MFPKSDHSKHYSRHQINGLSHSGEPQSPGSQDTRAQLLHIKSFNLYVTSQVEQLAARGETSSDLLINLFAAFMAVPDKKFVEYIEKQKDKYDEGEDVTTKKLMQVALIKVQGPQKIGPVAGTIPGRRTDSRIDCSDRRTQEAQGRHHDANQSQKGQRREEAMTKAKEVQGRQVRREVRMEARRSDGRRRTQNEGRRQEDVPFLPSLPSIATGREHG